MKLTASAPNKIHIAGEHSVVYGGWALMAPIVVKGKRNIAELSVTSCAKGSESITITLEDGEASLNSNGTKKGSEYFFPLFEAVNGVFKAAKYKFKGCGKKFTCKITYSGSPKGTGNSASIPAAIAAVFYSFLKKNPTKKDLFEAAFAVENAYHGGKASGGDLQAVVSDKPQLFRKVFKDKGVKFEYTDANLQLPRKTSILLVDSYRSGVKGNTADLIDRFAKANSIPKPPAELSDDERRKITLKYDKLVIAITAEFWSKGLPAKLAELMEENHALLRNAGVSSPDIEQCIRTAKQNGALGGKLVGAGGNGGAVIVLCPLNRESQVKDSLVKTGFKVYEVNFADKGASVQ